MTAAIFIAIGSLLLSFVFGAMGRGIKQASLRECVESISRASLGVLLVSISMLVGLLLHGNSDAIMSISDDMIVGMGVIMICSCMGFSVMAAGIGMLIIFTKEILLDFKLAFHSSKKGREKASA